MRRVITSLQDAYKLIKHGEDVILIYEVPSKCGEIVIRKTRFVPFAREQLPHPIFLFYSMKPSFDGSARRPD